MAPLALNSSAALKFIRKYFQEEIRERGLNLITRKREKKVYIYVYNLNLACKSF